MPKAKSAGCLPPALIADRSQDFDIQPQPAEQPEQAGIRPDATMRTGPASQEWALALSQETRELVPPARPCCVRPKRLLRGHRERTPGSRKSALRTAPAAQA